MRQGFPEITRGRNEQGAPASVQGGEEGWGLCSRLREGGHKTPDARPGSLRSCVWILPDRLPPGETSGKPPHLLGPRLPVGAPSLRYDSAAPRRVGDPQGASGGGSCLIPFSPTAATWECGPELPDLPKFQQEPKIRILKCKRSQFLHVGSNA